MKPFITAATRSVCRKCGHAKFDRILDDEDGHQIPLCAKCKKGKPKKYRVVFSLPVLGSNKFKKYGKSKNEIGETLDTLTRAKNFKSYIENKIKKEGANFDPRELGSEEERRIFYIKNLAPYYLTEQNKRVKRGELTPGGMRKIERVVRLYIVPIFKNYHLKSLTTPIIKREITKSGASPSVCAEIVKVFGPFLGYAVELGLIQARPSLPSYQKQRTYKAKDFYTKSEQSLVIQGIQNKKHRMAITMLAKYSARKSEIECLTWGDIDFKRETVKFNKHVSEKEIIPGLKSSPEKCLIYPFFPGLREMLVDMVPSLNKGDLVFPGRKGNLMGKNALWKAWTGSVDRLIKEKKITKKVDLHRGTRSTTLSALYEKGISVEELAELYGGDIRTMMKHYAKKEVQNVAHLFD